MLLGLAVATPGVAAGKNVRVERYDVDATLDPTGTLNVEERVVFVLTGGPFTRVYRRIPLRFADGVTIVSARGDGQPLSDGAPSGLVQSRTPGELFVEWQFPPASDVTRTLVLRYRVTGAVGRGEDGDRLLWSPLPSRHDYGIDHSQVDVRWPALGVAPVAVSTRRDDGVRVAEHVQRDTVRFVAARIRRNDNYQVRIAFPQEASPAMRPPGRNWHGPGQSAPALTRWLASRSCWSRRSRCGSTGGSVAPRPDRPCRMRRRCPCPRHCRWLSQRP